MLPCDATEAVLLTGAPAAEASHPGGEDGDEELQADAIAVPLRGRGGAVTPLSDVSLLFAQNQSKLKALKASDMYLWPFLVVLQIFLMLICFAAQHYCTSRAKGPGHCCCASGLGCCMLRYVMFNISHVC